jgi:hypothetical protein
MLYYPQLSTGAVSQFPIVRQMNRRTIFNRMPDGRVLKLADPDAASVLWRLEYMGLTDAERDSIETLFLQTEGRLDTFTFLDPTGNLLRWSGTLTNTVWNNSGLVQLQRDVEDPAGGTSAWRCVNAGQWQGISQQVDAPGSLRYCFSVTARSSSGSSVRLNITNAGEAATHKLSSAWRKVHVSSGAGQQSDHIASTLEIEAGGTVEVYGLQLDAQPSPSEYRRTEARSGVYKKTRFAEDTLSFTAEGKDNHRTTVLLISRTGDSQ